MASYSLDPHSQLLDEKSAAHLLRRATFGSDIETTKAFAGLSATDAFANLTLQREIPKPPVDPKTSAPWTNPPLQNKAGNENSENDKLFNFFVAWHLDNMRTDGAHLRERMTWFLHSHIPVSIDVVNSNEAIYYQNALYRKYALGNLKLLFKKICIDNAMLRYLDGHTNSRDEPNENFAREMFELYSIGKGPQIAEGNYTNFTEDDIKAATRVLTGFILDKNFENIDQETGIPTGVLKTAFNGGVEIATRHDAGEKIFSAAFGGKVIKPLETSAGFATKEAAMQELDELIEMIFEQKETARFICRKLYRFYVYHEINPDVEHDIIEPLADVFYNNNYEFIPVLSKLLTSKHFFDADNAETADNNIGALIKSPIEIIMGSLRFFNVAFPDKETQLMQFYEDAYSNIIFKEIRQQGMNLYEPFEVAGYPAYHQLPGFNRNWITATNLAYRYQFSDILMNRRGNDNPGILLNILEWVENSGHIENPGDPAEIVTVLTRYLYPIEIVQERSDYFLHTLFLEGLAPATWTSEWNAYKNSDDNTVVKLKLEVLLSAIIQTPEYQLF